MADTHLQLMAWWDAPVDRKTHEVIIPCLCDNVDWCVTEQYISDVRIAYKRIQELEGEASD